MARWHSCNVVEVGADAQRVWQFDARNGSFHLNREQTSRAGEPLPAKIVGKTWSSLYQKKLNVAWLPPEDVFIRVAQFPKASPEETRTMVELQLEKLSPIPVTQIVWTMHPLENAGAPMQTVIVVIVERSVVEAFLGRLESQGYQADRLELPLVDQLQATKITADGAWIYPETHGATSTALVAWWYGGVLQSVDLLLLPPEPDRAAGLKDQLMQMAWAGELEGWLTAPPAWHLVADDTAAATWVGPLQEGLEQRVEVVPPVSGQELAALTARRAAQADTQGGLLPAEFAARYRHQFVDRLWMRGLISALALYGSGVLIYFVALQVLRFQTNAAETSVRSISQSYTNAMQLKAQHQILKERLDLQYAALDCWQAVAETLPENITLDAMGFSESRAIPGGKVLTLRGSAPQTEIDTLFTFSDKLRRHTTRGQPLFNIDVWNPPTTTVNPGGATVRWSLDLELKRSER